MSYRKEPRAELRSVPPVQFRRRDDVRSLEADAAWLNLNLYSAEKGYNGRVPRSEYDAALMRKGTARQRETALEDLLALRQVVVDTDKAGATWLVFDWSHQPPAEVWQDDRARAIWLRDKALKRDRELCATIKRRDGDLCRYCGESVSWGANNSRRGATYDHKDPDPFKPYQGNTLENVVVACRSCNASKKDRTPQEAGMVLLEAGTHIDGRTEVEPQSDRGRTGAQTSRRSDSRPDTARLESNRDRTTAGPEPDREPSTQPNEKRP